MGPWGSSTSRTRGLAWMVHSGLLDRVEETNKDSAAGREERVSPSVALAMKSVFLSLALAC